MTTPSTSSALIKRLRIYISGTVQGVGFRPFVFKAATHLKISGWVQNSPQGVILEAEGQDQALQQFLEHIKTQAPPHAVLDKCEESQCPPLGSKSFEIKNSQPIGVKMSRVLPDLAVCSECLSEIFDPKNRRYRYPFTNCTQCGPRFSIISGLPYDRPNTTMKNFSMCEACRREYDDPVNRRFHAQPNACNDCGPHLEYWDTLGGKKFEKDQALKQTAASLKEGQIAAVKGLGGFHLMTDARNDQAVKNLRDRKKRPDKPFAVMFPDLESLRSICDISREEEKFLTSASAPIVLLRKKPGVSHISKWVAPDNAFLGVMLPYTPLHALLCKELQFPIVATSGNLSEEPICTDEYDAVNRLGKIADCFLVHNRPIVRPMDDSLLRVVLGRPLIFRAARGLAPLDIVVPNDSHSIFAAGGHLKNTLSLSRRNQVVLSQHIGDLETPESIQSFKEARQSLGDLFEIKPSVAACDLHPDYASTQLAFDEGVPVKKIQHHHAHIVSCMAEHHLEGLVLGVAWDGAGLGPDGNIWGGEFLKTSLGSFDRAASFRPFSLPGGEKAEREPRRMAFSLAYEILGPEIHQKKETLFKNIFSEQEWILAFQMCEKKINSPLTSSVGRLFDAVASLMGLAQTISFEGQAAMRLEHLLDGPPENEAYPFMIQSEQNGRQPRNARHPAMPLCGIQNLRRKVDNLDSGLRRNDAFCDSPNGIFLIDWEPMIRAVIEDVDKGSPLPQISAKFHNMLVHALVEIAKKIDLSRVVLSGGCFQNGYLLENSVRKLQAEGFEVFWPKDLPPNDGGLCLGQSVIASSLIYKKEYQPSCV